MRAQEDLSPEKKYRKYEITIEACADEECNRMRFRRAWAEIEERCFPQISHDSISITCPRGRGVWVKPLSG